MFHQKSKAIVYGKHLDVVGRMLDFDFLSDRSPSVAAIIDPTTKQSSFAKVFYGKSEILIPIFRTIWEVPEDGDIDTFLNFASFRSATEATWEALQSGKFQTIVIIAEGIPEREIREIIAYNEQLQVTSWMLKVKKTEDGDTTGWINMKLATWNLQQKVLIIWPATAGAIAGGVMRMGNAGGSLENIVESGLYRKWSVGFVSKSGGMSNEMYRVISKRTDGIHTGIALGGDRFTGSIFSDIVLRYEENPEIKMIVLLGEVWGRDELEVAELVASGRVKKPVVAYVSGTFAEELDSEVQFWHAGAKANKDEEKASYKNDALRKAGAYVPESYADFGDLIQEVYKETVSDNWRKEINGGSGGETVWERWEKETDKAKRTSFSTPVPLSGIGTFGHESTKNVYIEEQLAIIKNRKPTRFTSTISDERTEDVLYNKKPLETYVNDGSLAKVIGALWLKRELPDYASDFLNTVLILLADHGPAVSGATNSIITARAGKDILSSLVAGLMTIGPRFGGAIDGAAKCFYEAVKNGETPEDFVNRMKKLGTPIPGIGHKVKSKFHPDGRCTLLRNKVSSYQLPVTGSSKKSDNRQLTTDNWDYLSFALAVEAITLEKRPNLILNVDGHIAAIFLDIFRSIGMSDAEIEMYIDAGIFNAFFILARSIGFIGHALDQKRLGEPLYRTPWEDILYE